MFCVSDSVRLIRFLELLGTKTEAGGKHMSIYVGLQTQPFCFKKTVGLPAGKREWVGNSQGSVWLSGSL